MTLTQDAIYLKLSELCRLQAQVDAAKAELEPFMAVGETFSCADGKLTKTKGSTTFTANAEGQRRLDAFKADLESLGLAKYTVTKSSLRLTLTK